MTANKVWTVTSGSPRVSHAQMDGEQVDIEEPFSNGLMFPGDPSGDVDEVAGCTCTMDIEVTGEAEGEGGDASAAASAAASPSALDRVAQMAQDKLTAWEKDKFGSWEQSVSTDESEAFKTYRSSDYKAINRVLRDPSEAAGRYDAATVSDAQRTADSMRTALDRSAVPEDIRVTRYGDLPKGLKTGDTFTDRGFVSTTMKDDPKADFSIKVPKGSKGAPMDTATAKAQVSASPTGELVPSGEREFVLQSGTQYRYVGESAGQAQIEVVPEQVSSTAAAEAPAEAPALSGDSALSAADKAFATTRDSLSEDELKAITRYGGRSYGDVNAHLRGIEAPQGFRAPMSEGEINDMVSHLDSSFSKATPIDQNITAYRGAGDASSTFGNVGSANGKVFEDKAFVSTSSDLDKAMTRVHGDPGDKALIEIRIPQGTRTLSPELAKTGSRGMAPENEILLNRGSRFKILSDFVDDNGIRHISVERL